ncbi:YtxH-like protein [compost metagenome]
MNYKKLISSRMPNLSYKPSDNAGSIVALLAGLAVGAVLGVLFAPESGKRTRRRISDKAVDAVDSIQDGYQSIRRQVSTRKDDLVDLKDRMVNKVKAKAAVVSQDFQDFKDSELEEIKSKVHHDGNTDSI